ncbi:hypothetical protein E2542_SST10554 [Spatholobus suberectus]|nr:hypothetical protein E2542_SST10554 [Spatholobus suberectus]
MGGYPSSSTPRSTLLPLLLTSDLSSRPTPKESVLSSPWSQTDFHGTATMPFPPVPPSPLPYIAQENNLGWFQRTRQSLLGAKMRAQLKALAIQVKCDSSKPVTW